MNFDQVYDEYADTVYSYLCFRLRDHHLAEDVFQETFMSIYANLDALRAAQSKKAWILTIAHRKMVDRIRKQSSEATPDEIREQSESSNDQRLVAQMDLERFMQRLDDVSRQILYGVYVEKLTYKELAEILQMPEGTVKSKCYYARNKLKEWYKEGALQHD
jgi:RNA polymerase sigma factor (sigma-70 family)